MDSIQDVSIVEPRSSQPLAVFRVTVGGVASEFLSKFTKGFFTLVQTGLLVVGFDFFDNGPISCQGTEILPVSFYSVETIVDSRNHSGQ